MVCCTRYGMVWYDVLYMLWCVVHVMVWCVVHVMVWHDVLYMLWYGMVCCTCISISSVVGRAVGRVRNVQETSKN